MSFWEQISMSYDKNKEQTLSRDGTACRLVRRDKSEDTNTKKLQ